VVESKFSDRPWLSFSLALAKPNNTSLLLDLPKPEDKSDLSSKIGGQYSIRPLLLSFPQDGRNDSIPLPDCYIIIAVS
jgi:hypothetical protein